MQVVSIINIYQGREKLLKIGFQSVPRILTRAMNPPTWSNYWRRMDWLGDTFLVNSLLSGSISYIKIIVLILMFTAIPRPS